MKFLTQEEVIKRSEKIPTSFFKDNGIYFLLKDNEIVYVGKSENMPYRISTHLKEKVKDFDSYFTITVEDDKERGASEAYYIAVFNPKYNLIPAEKKYQKELLSILLKERSGIDVPVFKKEPTEKQKAYYKKMKDEQDKYWKEVSDEINRKDGFIINEDGDAEF